MATGRVRSKTHIIPKAPKQFFIRDILAVTVRRASDMDGPTMGIKLPTANFAVFIDKESAL